MACAASQAVPHPPPPNTQELVMGFLEQELLRGPKFNPFSMQSEVNPQPKLNLSRRAEGEYA